MLPYTTYKEIINLLSNPDVLEAGIIPWGTPILYFGKAKNARIATLGINPSNKEFFDNSNNILIGSYLRFHTLQSLKINGWDNLSEEHYSLIKHSYDNYFNINPYNTWFKKLDYILSANSRSYYFPSEEICHLDLIPFATFAKWSDISTYHQKLLLQKSSDILAEILNSSQIETIILNGSSVVRQIETVCETHFSKNEIEEWRLMRNGEKTVKGIAYQGKINRINDRHLNREINVIGFNHNIQSSFGLTKEVTKAMRNWISNKIEQL